MLYTSVRVGGYRFKALIIAPRHLPCALETTGEDRYFQVPNARYAIGLVPASLVLVAAFFDSRKELRVAGWLTIALTVGAGLASLHT